MYFSKNPFLHHVLAKGLPVLGWHHHPWWSGINLLLLGQEIVLKVKDVMARATFNDIFQVYPSHFVRECPLDPDPKVRRKLQRQMRKRLKRGKGSTSTSSSTSSGTSEGKEDDELLEDRSKIQKLADHGPGLLAAAVIRNMKPFVVQTTGGTWDLDMDSLPPIMSQYARCYLSPRSSGGLLREAYTLAHIGDLLLMARPAEALDALGQRLKSLELMMGGQHWSTAQRVEVVPPMEATMSSRAELQLAQKEANLDSRIKGTGSQWEKGKGKTKTKEREKGKEKGKGSGKQKDEGKKSS